MASVFPQCTVPPEPSVARRWSLVRSSRKDCGEEQVRRAGMVQDMAPSVTSRRGAPVWPQSSPPTGGWSWNTHFWGV